MILKLKINQNIVDKPNDRIVGSFLKEGTCYENLGEYQGPGVLLLIKNRNIGPDGDAKKIKYHPCYVFQKPDGKEIYLTANRVIESLRKISA